MEKDKDNIKDSLWDVHQPLVDPGAIKSTTTVISSSSGTTHPSSAEPTLEQLELTQTIRRVHALEQQMEEVQIHLGQASSFNQSEVNIEENVPQEQATGQLVGYTGKHALEKFDVTSLLEKLNKVFAECSNESWDGYDSKPLSRGAYLEARKLLKIIPLEFPTPDIVAEPDGDIGLEWYRGKGFSLILSLDGSKTITYASRVGKNETYGTEELTESFPDTITHVLMRLYLTANK